LHFSNKKQLKNFIAEGLFFSSAVGKGKNQGQTFFNTTQFIQIKPFTFCLRGFKFEEIKLL